MYKIYTKKRNFFNKYHKDHSTWDFFYYVISLAFSSEISKPLKIKLPIVES